MGGFRFFLSIMVALSHAGIYFYGFNQGVVAVAIFLIISGYTTDIVLEKKYATLSTSSLKAFYINKLTRIFPEYLFYVVFTLVVICVFHLEHETIHQIEFGAVCFNLLLVPIAYSSMFGVFANAFASCLVIPAAWTLGLQFTYYFISPFLRFLMEKRKRIGVMFFFLSFFLFCLSVTNRLNGYFGYSYIFGSLWIFLLGAYIRDEKYKVLISGGVLLACLMFLYIGKTGNYAVGFNKEILMGVCIGFPVVYLLKDFPRGKIDNFLGSISFGIYLNHFTVKTILINIWNHEPCKFIEWLIMILLSILLATISYFLIHYLNKAITNLKASVIRR